MDTWPFISGHERAKNWSKMATQGKFLFFDPSRGSFFWLIWTKNVIFDIFPTGIRLNRRLNTIGRDPFQQFSIFDYIRGIDIDDYRKFFYYLVSGVGRDDYVSN